MAFEVISARQLNEWIGNKNYMIVDLRSEAEYKRGHVKDARNIPYEEFERNNFHLPKDKKIVLYCERGATSFLVARKLHDKGYQVYTVVGGYNAIRK
jgi:rhodanese-related sulfurtransferase